MRPSRTPSPTPSPSPQPSATLSPAPAPISGLTVSPDGFKVHTDCPMVQPLVVVDNSAFSPSRLTAPSTLPILASQGSSPCFHFQLRGF